MAGRLGHGPTLSPPPPGQHPVPASPGLSEAYHAAVDRLVIGRAPGTAAPGARRSAGVRGARRRPAGRRVREPGDQRPARLLEAGGRLDARLAKDLEDLAWDVWRVGHDVQDALSERAAREWERDLPGAS